MRQRVQPVVVFWSKLVARPKSGSGGQGIEVIQFKQTSGGLVVIAADENFSQIARAIDDLVGRSSVTDNVAQIRHEVEGGSCGHAGFQGFEVGVNVAQQQYAQ